MTTVLTVNAGSSSLRLDLVDGLVDGGTLIDSAHAERAVDPRAARDELSAFLGRHHDRDIEAVAHRLVHGGEAVRVPAIADDETVAAVRAFSGLAPLHLPPALALVDAARELLPALPHVLCPDTAFHADLPGEAATYALPSDWRERHGLRRYGFHGLSYGWAADRVAELTGRPVEELDLVLTHLGGGSSVCAVSGGRSLDTSMGFTPLDGVPMSRRSGGVDPGMLLWLLSEGGLTLDELSEGLWRRSGLTGLSGGRSGDTRELVAAQRDGDQEAALAMAVFCHRVSREIAAAATSLGRIDALVFTGEIGWDQPEVRHDVCRRLRVLGVEPPAVAGRDDDGLISARDAAVPVFLVEPREALQLARECLKALA
ncbi:acetate/propionate family kinase [Nonomuraea lactucae]|uniref:acetate/propionate family kinase n=1 Tax=Nonomuraea lactucae TaxID=2249762 RepID=UPI001F050BDF|nr:acetate/propionate family kinase [Nonomuraea lactucae]